MPGYLLDTNILPDLVHHPRTDGIWPESSKYIESSSPVFGPRSRTRSPERTPAISPA